MPGIWTLNTVVHASGLSSLQLFYPFFLSAHINLYKSQSMWKHSSCIHPFPVFLQVEQTYSSLLIYIEIHCNTPNFPRINAGPSENACLDRSSPSVRKCSAERFLTPGCICSRFYSSCDIYKCKCSVNKVTSFQPWSHCRWTYCMLVKNPNCLYFSVFSEFV